MKMILHYHVLTIHQKIQNYEASNQKFLFNHINLLQKIKEIKQLWNHYLLNLIIILCKMRKRL